MNILHELFGHVGENATKLTAEYYEMKTSGDFNPCESCAMGKARQRNLGRVDEEKRSTIPGERMGFDISSVKTESFGGSKYWLLVVDHATDHCRSFF